MIKTTISLAEFRANVDFYLQQAQTQPITISGQQDSIFMDAESYRQLEARAKPVTSDTRGCEDDISKLIEQRVYVHAKTFEKLAQR